MTVNNIQSVPFAWRHFKDNYPAFVRKFGQPIVDSRLIGSFTQQFDTMPMHDEVKEFFRTRSNSPYVEQALSGILRRIQFINSIYEDLRRYFE